MQRTHSHEAESDLVDRYLGRRTTELRARVDGHGRYVRLYKGVVDKGKFVVLRAVFIPNGAPADT